MRRCRCRCRCHPAAAQAVTAFQVDSAPPPSSHRSAQARPTRPSPAAEGFSYWRIAQWCFPFYSFTPPGVLGLKMGGNARVPMDDTHTLALVMATSTAPGAGAEFDRLVGSVSVRRRNWRMNFPSTDRCSAATAGRMLHRHPVIWYAGRGWMRTSAPVTCRLGSATRMRRRSARAELCLRMKPIRFDRRNTSAKHLWNTPASIQRSRRFLEPRREVPGSGVSSGWLMAAR